MRTEDIDQRTPHRTEDIGQRKPHENRRYRSEKTT